MPPEKLQLEAPLRRGRHVGAVHRVRRLRHRVPARRARLPRHRGRLQAVPARGGLRARTTAATARRAARRAPAPARASGRGSPRSTSSCSAGPAPPTSRRASTRTSCSPAPPTRCSPRSARTAASCRRILLYALEHDMIDAALVSYLEGDGTIVEGDPGRRPHQARTIIASAGSRYTYSANTMAYADADRERRRAHRARRHELPVVGAAGDEAAQGGQGRPPPRRSTSGCCAPRRSTTPSSRSSSRRSTA